MLSRVDISVVIPARNEVDNITAVVSAIRQELCDSVEYEIIVIDNQSIDGTAAVARRAGADKVETRDGTISELRNYGAALGEAPVVAFVDADVIVCEGWGAAVKLALATIADEPKAVVGAHYGYGRTPSWIERVWLDPKFRIKSSYVPGGNLMLARDTLFAVGGFSEELATGEDVDLCRKIKEHGGSVELSPALVTHHVGNPRTLGAFISRERWHGIGDFVSLKAVLDSKVALTALAWLFLHCALLIMLLVSPSWSGILLLTLLLLCFLASVYKFGFDRFAFHRIVLQYCYFLGRSISAVEAGTRCLRRGVKGFRIIGRRADKPITPS